MLPKFLLLSTSIFPEREVFTSLIGATDREHSAGNAVLSNLLRTTKRPLYPVNPQKQTVFGVRCFPSIGDVPSHISIAVIVTPAPTVPLIVEECGKAGVSVAIILSAGFSEEDERELENKIIAARQKYGMRIIGPNSRGVILPHIGLNATFLTVNPKPGNIALIRPLLGDAKRFIGAARGFAMSKPIVVFKPGRSKAGSQLINIRTGKQTGDERDVFLSEQRCSPETSRSFLLANMMTPLHILTSRSPLIPHTT